VKAVTTSPRQHELIDVHKRKSSCGNRATGSQAPQEPGIELCVCRSLLVLMSHFVT
jgi:hypothetical protein